jgi:four helix bundle protein
MGTGGQKQKAESRMDGKLTQERRQKAHMRGRLPTEFCQRATSYAAQIICLSVKLPKNGDEIRVLRSQLIRSGTSVAAHVREAARARSRAEFASKLGGALQEADESLLWLELLREECSVESTLTLEAESSELIAIFTTMTNRTLER